MTEKPNITILNVDDHDGTRYATTRFLRKAGYQIIEAANGTDALKLAKRSPDLVILDVNLPDIDGFEVCRRLKSDRATSMIPVVHLSATYQDDEAKVTGLESGADGYLTHPVEARVLVAYVRALLRTRQAEANLSAAGRQWEATFDAMNDCICLLDKRQKILRCNTAMAKFLGKPFRQIISRHCWEVVYETTAPIDACPFKRMMEGKSRQELVLRRGDRCVQHSVDPVLDSAGHVTGAVGIFSDITELKRAEESLRKARDELEQRVEERTAEIRRLSAQLLAVQEDERKKISRDLHDSIGQCLAAIKFRIETILTTMHGSKNRETVDSLEALALLAQLASEETRRIHADLRPPLLDDLGIVATISWFCRQFEDVYPPVKIEKDILLEEKDVPVSLKTPIFRILQEALNNVSKHSNAKLVRVLLRQGDGKMQFVIEDNGQGFDIQRAFSRKASEGGFGLTSMKERAELSGGCFSIDSIQGAGTTIRASWSAQMPG